MHIDARCGIKIKHRNLSYTVWIFVVTYTYRNIAYMNVCVCVCVCVCVHLCACIIPKPHLVPSSPRSQASPPKISANCCRTCRCICVHVPYLCLLACWRVHVSVSSSVSVSVPDLLLLGMSMVPTIYLCLFLRLCPTLQNDSDLT